MTDMATTDAIDETGGALRTVGIATAILFGVWGTLLQVVTLIGLAWVIPAFAMAGRTNRPWYNVMNWLWGLGPFALIILGRPRKRYPSFGAMVRDNVAASVAIGLVGGFALLLVMSALAQS